MLPKTNILGVDITDATSKQILEYVINLIKLDQEKVYIVTPNPEMVVLAQAQPEFRHTLNKADIALCDGVGLSVAGWALGKPLKERITGVEMMELLCKESVRNGFVVGFLGGEDGVALRASECLRILYPGLKVGFAQNEWPKDGNLGNVSPKELKSVDILFVAFGFPKQELWIAENLAKLPVKIAMGVGGAFDYLSGDVTRAPKVVRLVGMEWLFRLIVQPWRYKRQLKLLTFIKLVLLRRIGVSS